MINSDVFNTRNIVFLMLLNKILVLAKIIIAAIKILREVKRDDIESVINMVDRETVKLHWLSNVKEYEVISINIENDTHQAYFNITSMFSDIKGSMSFSICLYLKYLLCLTRKNVTLLL